MKRTWKCVLIIWFPQDEHCCGRKIVKIITEEKTSTFPLRGQKNAMAEMAQIMNLCMKGQLKELRQTYVLEYENGKGHRVTIRS